MLMFTGSNPTRKMRERRTLISSISKCHVPTLRPIHPLDDHAPQRPICSALHRHTAPRMEPPPTLLRPPIIVLPGGPCSYHAHFVAPPSTRSSAAYARTSSCARVV